MKNLILLDRKPPGVIRGKVSHPTGWVTDGSARPQSSGAEQDRSPIGKDTGTGETSVLHIDVKSRSRHRFHDWKALPR